MPGIRYTPNHQPNLKESLSINDHCLFYCNVFDLNTRDSLKMLQLHLEIVHFLDELGDIVYKREISTTFSKTKIFEPGVRIKSLLLSPQ